MKPRIMLIASLFLPFLFACNPKGPAPDTKIADTVAVAKAPDNARMIVAKVFIKPGKEANFIKEAKTMIENTLKEPGCESYQLYQNPYEKSSFVFVEAYKNQAAVEAHFASSYFKDFGPRIKDIIAKNSDVKIYDIAGVK